MESTCKALNVNQICASIESRELRQFEMALQHKSKVRFFQQLKGEVGLGGRYANKQGSQECPNCEALKELVEQVLFECVSYDSQHEHFLDHFKEVHPVEAFICGSVFTKACFV